MTNITLPDNANIGDPGHEADHNLIVAAIQAINNGKPDSTALGNAATRNVGTGSAEVATGNHSHTLDGLSDVSAPSPSVNQALVWSGSAWTPATVTASSPAGTFNVKSYGAVGNGSTDDTTAINAAIAAVNASTYGGVLYFPAGDYRVTSSLTTITKPCTVRGDGRSEWYSISDSVSKVSTTSTTATIFTFNARSGAVENITIHNKNYLPAPLNPYPGLGGFESPLPAVLAGTLPTAGAGIHAIVGDGFRTHNVMVAGFYDNIDQESGVNVVHSELQSWAPVRYGLRVRNANWVDAGGTNIWGSFFFGHPKYSKNTYCIKYESGGGMWITHSGFSGMGEAGPGEDTGVLWAIHTDYQAGGSGNLYTDSVGIESCANGIYVSKGDTVTWWHTSINNTQFSPYGSKLGTGTTGVYIKGSPAYPVQKVRISGFFSSFPNNQGTGVKLENVQGVELNLMQPEPGDYGQPGNLYTLSNVTGLKLLGTTATTNGIGLMPALNNNASSYLNGQGQWVTPAAASTLQTATATNTTNIQLNGVSPAILPWDTEEHDDGGFHSTSVNPTRFINNTGSVKKCRLDAVIRCIAAGSTIGTIQFYIRKNGSTELRGGDTKLSVISSEQATFHPTSGWVTLNNGDYLEVVGTYQTGAGSLTTVATASVATFEVRT
jgi:hypothetical protein